MASISDVAKRAGVSRSTVSLVCNNKGYVSQETREKILRVAGTESEKTAFKYCWDYYSGYSASVFQYLYQICREKSLQAWVQDYGVWYGRERGCGKSISSDAGAADHGRCHYGGTFYGN